MLCCNVCLWHHCFLCRFAANFISLNKRLKIFINYFLGPVLLICLCFSIYHGIMSQPDKENSWQKVKESLYGDQLWKVVMVVFLMLFNWGIEAVKWQVLVRHIQSMSFLTAFKAVFAGVSFAMNTPNRVGEYVGRILYIEEGNRLRAVMLTFVGSFSQFVITILFGGIGLIFLYYFLSNENIPNADLLLIWIGASIYSTLIAGIGLTLSYFRIRWFVKLLEKIPVVAKYAYFIQKLEELEARELLKVLLLSLMRYSIFIVQYLLLLQVFEVNIDWLHAVSLTCVMFLALAVVPTIALAELGLRGQVSISLFTLFNANKLGIVLTASGIWLINLVIPALAGSLFILGKKIFRKK